MMLRRVSGARAGVTMLEVMIAVSVLGILTTGVMGTVGSSTGSSARVTTSAMENAELRKSGKLLSTELRSAGGDRFELTDLPDGNSELTFQVPVAIGAVASWGVYDRYLGTTEADWNRADWSLRYTVVPGPDDTSQLVRQVLDDLDVVQRQTVITEDLRDGLADPPGFRVEDMGDVWEVIITTTHARVIGGESGGAKFHVRSNN